MRQLAPMALAACLFAAPVLSQDAPDTPETEISPETSPETEPRGRSLMERGAELFFRGLKDELDPALKELEGLADEMEPALRSFRDEMGPALRELMGKVQDWSRYSPPEMLPNGDIILRRKEPLPPQDPLEPGENGEIDL